MRHAVIMAGGSGTRLWPMSRRDQPKQLIPFLPGGQSLLGLAIERIIPLIEDERGRWVCTSAALCEQIAKGGSIGAEQLLGEPIGRDTLNAVGFAAAVIVKRDPEAVLAILTADHLITPVEAFRAGLRRGFELIERYPETLVTFNILPNRPATEYGYIERGGPVAGSGGAHWVKQYVEKPDQSTAERYLAAGNFGWSSGMFAYKATTILAVIQQFQPECFVGLMQIQAAWDTAKQEEVLAAVYPTLPRISIDYAIMEPASRAAEIPVATVDLKIDWLDLGSWSAFAQLLEQDAHGNRINTATSLLATENCLIVSDDPQHEIALIGCADLIVIHTQNATLVCPRNREQEIRRLVAGRNDG